ncbi:hypothetical protein BGY98DRAFT_744058 [Russula aff. rugulosa BPL654]|nr:hypothetical protein BGY98DRAFT_744058 [Russula aff. rugulosa BPL654]
MHRCLEAIPLRPVPHIPHQRQVFQYYLSPAPLLIVPAASLASFLTCFYHFVLLVFPHPLSRAYIMIHVLFGGKSRFYWSNRHFISSTSFFRACTISHIGIFSAILYYCILFRRCINLFTITISTVVLRRGKEIFHVVHNYCGSSRL